MTTIEVYGTPSVAGSIIFYPQVSREVLIGAVHELALKADKRRLIDLHLRADGDDGAHVIAFRYQMHRGTRKEQRKIIKGLVAFLSERLGLKPKKDMDWTMSTVIVSA